MRFPPMRYAVPILLLALAACEQPPPEIERAGGLAVLPSLVRLDTRTLAEAHATTEGGRVYEHARQWLMERGYRKDSTAYGEPMRGDGERTVLVERREYFSKP